MVVIGKAMYFCKFIYLNLFSLVIIYNVNRPSELLNSTIIVSFEDVSAFLPCF